MLPPHDRLHTYMPYEIPASDAPYKHAKRQLCCSRDGLPQIFASHRFGI
jgi:hypothetical protein